MSLICLVLYTSEKNISLISQKRFKKNCNHVSVFMCNGKKETVIKCLFPNWFSNELKYLIRDKKRAHKLFKAGNFDVDYNTFSKLRTSCRPVI